ncbi:DEAD/DEAH box helicase [Bacillus suaedaesalsae]|uniref:DEAD/DEAH box helicase n=1 Tax=Bacillus suaedaesalsae TaxID=2810349 RepID=A0ABS2DM81_9BACI|nr:DEAD/DEAH box helicase [Bacillus suaedaesalsae]MBM6619170.1 DEAD/DEAH box helicase [Bacillus suaedaesalsae]
MLEIKTMIGRSEWLSDKGMFLWCENEAGFSLDLEDWKHDAFARHEATFYGTFLKKHDWKRQEGALLSPWIALDYLANPNENSLSRIHWDEDATYLKTIASALMEAIQFGDFMPDFDAWLEGKTAWRHTSLVLSDTEKELFSLAVQEFIESDQELFEQWKELQSRYPLLKKKGMVVDEDDWLQKIGWQEDPSRFRIGLRLEEPLEDGLDWHLEVVLRDKEIPDELIPLNEVRELDEESSLSITRAIDRWTSLIPWLQHGESIKQTLSEIEAFEFLTGASTTLTSAGVEILLPSWWQSIKDSQAQLKAKVKNSPSSSRQSFVGMNAIIQYDWRLSTNGIDISEEEFTKLVEEKRRLINIRGRWIRLDPNFIKQVQTIMQKANREGLRFWDVLEQELLQEDREANVEELESAQIFRHIQIEINEQLSGMIRKLTEAKELPPVEVPATFKGELRPYQKHGVEWLSFLRGFGFGACLADDMGLGKTVQMITYFLHVKEKENPKTPALIICPTSVLGNWQRELEKFAPSLNVHLHYGANRKKEEQFKNSIKDADIVITSYGLAHLDLEELQDIQWSSLCIDEAQNIKNADTKQSRSVRSLNGNHHIALTGTPMENRLSELWAIYDFINRGYLGSLTQFHKRFVVPIERDHEKERVEMLQKMIRPFLLRRTKKDQEVALNLPDKQEQKEYCALTVEQASLYEQLVKDTFEQIEALTGMQRKGLVLKMLGKLKQVCNHPSLYLKEEKPKDIVTRSNKMEKLAELVQNIRDQEESCIIFTQYISMGNMIREFLENEFKEPVRFLHGGTSKVERDRMIQDFQEGKQQFLILSLKAGGTGLNLTAANHVIHYDRWWNPAVENQATDRAYRIGQTKFVHVHKLITNGTLEEKIDEMLEKKQQLNEEIIQSEAWITELSTRDLHELFSLRSGWSGE